VSLQGTGMATGQETQPTVLPVSPVEGGTSSPIFLPRAAATACAVVGSGGRAME